MSDYIKKYAEYISEQQKGLRNSTVNTLNEAAEGLHVHSVYHEGPVHITDLPHSEESISNLQEATYSYDDNKAPKGAEISTGYGDINDKAVHAHLASKGVPHAHAKAIVAHLKHDDHDDSDKRGYDVKSTHDGVTVHSYSDPDTGKSKFHVS